MSTSVDLWHPDVVYRVLACSNHDTRGNLRKVNRKFKRIVDHHSSFLRLRSIAEARLTAPVVSISRTRRIIGATATQPVTGPLRRRSPTKAEIIAMGRMHKQPMNIQFVSDQEFANLVNTWASAHKIKYPTERPFYFSEYQRLHEKGLPTPPVDHLIFDVDSIQNDPINDNSFQTIIARFPNLNILTISHLELLSDVSLISIGTMLPMLHTLEFCGNRLISDTGIKGLVKLPLRYLDLGGSKGASRITDRGLGDLAGISTLQHLKLSECLHITDAGLYELLNLNLVNLDIQECNNIGDVGMGHLAHMGALQTLWIGGRRLPGNHRLTELGVTKLLALPHLTKLVLATSLQDITIEARDRLKKQGLPLFDL